MTLNDLLSHSEQVRGLNDEQLATHIEAANSEFERLAALDEPTPGQITVMDQLVGAQTKFLTEDRRRIEESGQAAERRDSAVSKMAALSASAGPRGSTGTMVQRMAANQRRATPSPTHGKRPQGASSPVVTASASGRTVARGRCSLLPMSWPT